MYSKILLILSASLFFHQEVWADPRLPGGSSSVSISSVQAFSLPVKGLTGKELTRFMVGNSVFRSNWVASPASVERLQGLGPLFNARSCAGCHTNDGRSSVTEENGILGTGLLFRISVLKEGVHSPHPVYGDQIQPQGIINVRGEATPMVKYEEITGRYSDGTEYKLRKPTYWIKDYLYGEIKEKVFISPRVSPHMIGLGLLELVSEKSLLQNSDPDDSNRDGISGRPNYIPVNGKKVIGRFGWKANQPDLISQNTGALLGDLGITSSRHASQNCNAEQTDCLNAHALNKLEINEDDLERLTFYTQTLAVPVRRDFDHPSVVNGEKIFKQIGCTSCHTPSFTTGKSKLPQLNQQKIYPYTDMLLHDMGEELADHRPDFLATGTEWRTPPLWGIGLLKTVNRHQMLLHDGRARNIEEAILWHGGEAKHSQEAFKKLTKTERTEIIKFIESL